MCGLYINFSADRLMNLMNIIKLRTKFSYQRFGVFEFQNMFKSFISTLEPQVSSA
jgi:hypothetical protein